MTPQRQPSPRDRRFDRRTLLTSAAVAAASGPAILTGPSIVVAQDDRGDRDLIVGSGEHTYRCHHFWGHDALPAGHDYGNASHGVAIDRSGMIYITHNGRPGSLFVFDPEGRFVRSMGDFHATRGRDDQTTASGHGIDIREENGEEFLYLAAANPEMSFAKVSLGGELVWQRGRDEIFEAAGLDRDPPRFRPTNVSFRPDGGYYLGDGYGSFYLFEYDAQDRFVRTIGGPGKEDGKFATPHGQWFDDRDGVPKLVVADRANERLQWFDLDGNHLRTQGGFLFPADIDRQGEWLLVPDLHARVTILDAGNEPVAQLGDDPQWRAEVLADNFRMRTTPGRWRAGRFVHPHDACFDADGNIFVTEWVRGGRVTKLQRVA